MVGRPHEVPPEGKAALGLTAIYPDSLPPAGMWGYGTDEHPWNTPHPPWMLNYKTAVLFPQVAQCVGSAVGKA